MRHITVVAALVFAWTGCLSAQTDVPNSGKEARRATSQSQQAAKQTRRARQQLNATRQKLRDEEARQQARAEIRIGQLRNKFERSKPYLKAKRRLETAQADYRKLTVPILKALETQKEYTSRIHALDQSRASMRQARATGSPSLIQDAAQALLRAESALNEARQQAIEQNPPALEAQIEQAAARTAFYQLIADFNQRLLLEKTIAAHAKSVSALKAKIAASLSDLSEARRAEALARARAEAARRAHARALAEAKKERERKRLRRVRRVAVPTAPPATRPATDSTSTTTQTPVDPETSTDPTDPEGNP